MSLWHCVCVCMYALCVCSCSITAFKASHVSYSQHLILKRFFIELFFVAITGHWAEGDVRNQYLFQCGQRSLTWP